MNSTQQQRTTIPLHQNLPTLYTQPMQNQYHGVGSIPARMGPMSGRWDCSINAFTSEQAVYRPTASMFSNEHASVSTSGADLALAAAGLWGQSYTGVSQ